MGMEEWKEYKLGELLSIRYGKDHKKLNDGIIPVYGSGGIMRYVNQSIYDSPSILIPRKGSLNNIIYTETPFWTVDTMFWTIVNTKLVDPKYLYYAICKFDFAGLNVGSAVPSLTVPVIGNIDIILPSLNKQKNIVNILSILDNKIELNRRINENLEQQAQALFDFYFIKHPETLGNCKSGNLIDIANYTNGLAMQRFRPWDSEKGIPVLKIKELGQGKIDSSSDVCNKNIPNEYIVNDGDIIFSWSGTLMVNVWCGGLCGLNQHLFKVTSDKYPKWYYYFWTKYHLGKFIRIAKDKAVTMGHIKRGDLETSEVLIPERETLLGLDKIISPILNQIIGIKCENNNLENLRDTLLPKLMSGELKINDLSI